jgi:Ser/Thr protein kinase RdoA (MazF antagonist)
LQKDRTGKGIHAKASSASGAKGALPETVASQQAETKDKEFGALAMDVFATTVANPADRLDAEMVRLIARDFYGLDARIEPLSGERDQNTRLIAADGAQYVLKLSNPAEEASTIDLSTAALLHLESVDAGFPCPRIVRDLQGRAVVRATLPDGRIRTVRVFTWLEGKLLAAAEKSAAQRASCGHVAARLSVALRTFSHSAAKRSLIWDIRHIGQMRTLLADMPNFPAHDGIAHILGALEDAITPAFPSLRCQFAHNDLNRRNILVDPKDESRIVGIIDFQDMVHTALIADVAVAASTQVISPGTAETEVSEFLAAYRTADPLLDHEMSVLKYLIAARLIMGLLIPAWYRMRNPATDHYAPLAPGRVENRLECARALLRATFV